MYTLIKDKFCFMIFCSGHSLVRTFKMRETSINRTDVTAPFAVLVHFSTVEIRTPHLIRTPH